MNLQFVEVDTKQNPNSSVIWLHGLGADGHDFESLVSELNLPNETAIRFIFPHAPVAPVTINGGYPMRSWFDILGLDKTANQDEVGIRRAQGAINQLIDQVAAAGIATNRIILGGFSQGGALALHTALRYPQKLAGAIGLSTYLPLAESAPNEKHLNNHELDIFLAHGTEDFVVPYQFGNISRQALLNMGYCIEWHDYPIGHSVCDQEIADISLWLQAHLL
jgi:phospholipase/carboxylesterase